MVHSTEEKTMGQGSWRLFEKPEELDEVIKRVVSEVVEAALEKDKEKDNQKFFFFGKAPVRLAAKLVIVTALGEDELAEGPAGEYNLMRTLAVQDPPAAAYLMKTLAPKLTGAHDGATALKFDRIVKRRNLLAQPSDIEELDESVEEAESMFGLSEKLKAALPDEYEIISNYKNSRPLLKAILEYRQL